MSKKRESFYLQSRELRAQTNADGSRSVSGVIEYNTPSQGLPWVELVAPGAFADALKPGADVLLLRDHLQENLLARTLSKTLVLEDSPNGLKFRASLPNTTVATDTIESISRGDLSGTSWGMIVNKDAWAEDGKGNVTRTLLSVSLLEISLTSFPCYPENSILLRSMPKEFRSLLSDPDNDEDECTCPEGEECTCKDTDDDEQWAERSRMRLALEQVRSYASYIR
jgi:uncharacterized protein